ncbi:MAG: VacB/RNase II family 3'-5' exoribonuclease [Bacteroidales bacterium]|jgi:ribonuclease R|nr:VacB/RNase II family 3'-5' exoribonuclease [Bacteroidales bacterium]
MPLSAKRIIGDINTRVKPFSRDILIKDLVTEPRVNRKKQSKGKKTKVKSPARNIRQDTARIDEVLSVLTANGFIHKKKKQYSHKPPLRTEATLFINNSGNGIAKTDHGEDIIIKKENTNGSHNKDRAVILIADYRQGIFSGVVGNIISRNREIFIAIPKKKTKDHIILQLMDVPGEIEVSAPDNGSIDFEKNYFIQLKKKFHGNRQSCEITGSCDKYDESFDLDRIRLRHNLPVDWEDVPMDIKDVLKGLPHKSEEKNRKDLRSLFAVTIDGPYSKDFDDAISLEHKRNKSILYVHIADVSAYVTPGSPLDQEAFKRATSYYIGNAVIPMLPEEISNELCSLKEKVDRYSMTAEMHFNKKGEMLLYNFYRSKIKVNHRLTYGDTEDMINGKKKGRTAAFVKKVNNLTLTLKKQRMTTGRVDLNLQETSIVYDGQKAVSMKVSERLQSNMLIEECMLSANEAVARTLRLNSVPSLYRVHEDMEDEKVESLSKFLKTLGIKFRGSENNGLAIQVILDAIRDTKTEPLVNMIVLRSMMQAFYGPEPLGHFGLGFTDYTHFTSPIRRYPDLVVHRCLKALIDSAEAPYNNDKLIQLGDHSSQMERVAQKAERDMLKLKSCRLMEDKVGQVFKAVISGVSKYGFYVTLIDMPVEGMVPMRVLTDDFYMLQEDDYTLIGKRFSKRFRIGDHLKVRLTSVEIELMRIDFEPR